MKPAAEYIAQRTRPRARDSSFRLLRHSWDQVLISQSWAGFHERGVHNGGQGSRQSAARAPHPRGRDLLVFQLLSSPRPRGTIRRFRPLTFCCVDMVGSGTAWSRRLCKPSTTHSGQGCHPCLRYVPLPMSPGRTRCSWRRERNPAPTFSRRISRYFDPLRRFLTFIVPAMPALRQHRTFGQHRLTHLARRLLRAPPGA